MYRRILVPLDGSADAETVLDHLQPLLAAGGEVILLHVLPEPHPATGEGPEAWLAVQRGADDYLSSVLDRGLQVPIKTFVDVGDPGDRIVRVASVVKADLVALVTHAWRGLPRVGLGDVARTVLRRAKPAVLFVPPWRPPAQRLRPKFLFPLEGPGWSRTEVDPIIPVAAARRAEVVLLHVEAPETDPLEGRRTDAPLSLAADDRRRKYREAADYLVSRGVEAQALTATGDPARQILEQAKSLEADLVAMSTHGRVGLERLVAGSVAESVIRLAGCPVLILRGAGVRSRALANGSKA